MGKRRTKGLTADRFVEATVELIAERGGSTGVNLREVSRRVGCAHTNAYNYFSSREDLMWATFHRVLQLYGRATITGLDDDLAGAVYFRRLFGNMLDWSLHNPGLHRFISSDPLDPEQIPPDVLARVTAMKAWVFEVLSELCKERLEAAEVESLGEVLLGYLDGEVLNLINGRLLPGDDIAGRVLGNLERLFTLLSARSCDGIVLGETLAAPGAFTFPKLEVTA